MVYAWTKLEVPLGAGLDTKGDLRAGRPPKLDIARDVQFSEPGGVQPRLPFLAFSNAIFGGGTLTNCRRLAVVNDELCVFTDTALYSWNAQLSQWVFRSTHLAVSVEETPRFTTQDDQVDGDRAELNGTVVYTWATGAGTVMTYVAAFDKTTGAVLMSPTLIPNVFRPRLVALATRILLFAADPANSMGVISIDPASPATGIAGGFVSVLAGTANLYYDVVKVEGQDLAIGVARRATTTSYTVFTVTPAPVVTTVTKARTADGPVAVATTPGTGVQAQVIRANGTNIQGDLLTTSTLADVLANQAVGTAASTTINQVTVALANANTVRAFWTSGSAGESTNSTGSDFEVKTNTIVSGTPGTQTSLRRRLGIASRAFAYNGNAYVWLAFAQENAVTGLSGAVAVGSRAALQNTYFLYREDGFLVGKALFDVAGGHCPNTGRLPGVAPTSLTGLDFAWCGARRRLIDLGGAAQGYEARSPTDIAFSFNSNISRRSASLGRSLYVADSIPLQYDGAGLFEVGFLIYPYNFFVTTGGGGSLAAGDYVYKSTRAWQNAVAEKERSTTAMSAKITAPGANKNAIQIDALNVTRKTAAAIAPTGEVWRTQVNPGTGAPYYLVTGKDPSSLAGAGVSNGYVPNDVTAVTLPATGFAVLNDNLADATLSTKEINPENDGALESLAPPGARIITATDTRLFLAGVAGDPDSVWYSRERGDGEVASFHDTLVIPVPRAGGAITALAFNNETLTVFRESAIYALPGDGLDNLGQGSNFGPARIISLDVGAVSQESVALTPLGLVFKSLKGWYLLTPAWQLRYIGAAVNAFDGDTVYAVTVVESEHHVRILTSGRLIAWDYSVVTEESPLGQWGEWTVSTGLDAVMWNGQYVVLTSTGPTAQLTTYTGCTFGLDAETTWLKPTEQQGEFFLRWLAALGEYRSTHLLRVRLARDYLYDGAGNPVYFDDVAWSPSPTVVGSALQVKHSPSTNRMQALKVRLTAVTEAVRATLVTTTLSPQVATSGSAWNATWRAARVGHGFTAYGEMGNRLTMSIAFGAFTPSESDMLPVDLAFDFESEVGSVQVRDHYTWSPTELRWKEDLDNIGVLVGGTVTVAELEAAIAEATTLATLSAADASPTKVIDVATPLAALSSPAASFAAGAYGSPTGEALKLTGLALEIGTRPGINRRLPAEQRV